MLIPTPNNPHTSLTRRSLLSGTAALALVALLPRDALALTDATARTLVDKLVAEINRVIDSGKSESAMIRDFTGIFDRYADVPIIARSCLGADVRNYSSAQIAAYTAVFRGYVGRKYGKRFREFIGGKVIVIGVRPVKTWHEVSAQAILTARAPFEVRFLVSDKSGKPLFFDLFIEGVSMRLTERTEIGSMLDRARGDIAKMTEALKSAG
ncbi:phospholipid-binding protein MlaC [Pseudooceanicola sp.]|uniref:MlaC/ttg2D family ABC transporter substrate-binding protein n=1 Tax=Pseudooceanicola sp. TaxID=1914328 RepID=UPI002615DF89|nr:ABC transporter substrate-binding protein [Pseudooceanicola sp.]MDF1856159.1 ABC transporter substrate-binding protein [Pseudooceanicola sp.]